jgi:hypothetical protein
LENKKKTRKTLLPPAGPFPGPNPRPHLPTRPRSSFPRPIFGLLPRARQPALRSPSLSLAKRPHPSAALSLSLALTPTGSVAPLVSCFVVLPPSLHRGHLRPSPPSPPPSSRRTGKFGTAPSSPLDQRPHRYRPAVVSPRRRCAAFMAGTV